MTERFTEVYVWVGVRSGTRRAFAVAVVAGREGHSELHRVAGDWPTADAAAAEVLVSVMGVNGGSPAMLKVEPVDRPDDERAEQFYERYNSAFDGASFPRGIGSA